MKKVFLLMAVAMFSIAASAQYYVGGSFGFGNGKESFDENGRDDEKVTSFSIAPEFGYSISDKTDVGIAVGFYYSKFDGVESGNFIEIDGAEKATTWGIAPYVRYSLIEFGKFAVLAKAELAVSGGSADFVGGGDSSVFGVGFNVAPMLKYTLSDKFDLLAGLNFMSLGVNYTKIDDYSKTTEFGLGVDTNNVATLGDVTVGFAFKF